MHTYAQSSGAYVRQVHARTSLQERDADLVDRQTCMHADKNIYAPA